MIKGFGLFLVCLVCMWPFTGHANEEAIISELKQQAKYTKQTHQNWLSAIKLGKQAQVIKFETIFNQQLQRQQKLLYKAAYQLADIEYQKFLNPQRAKVSVTEFCQKMQTEQECEDLAISNAKLELAKKGGAVSVKEESVLQSNRVQSSSFSDITENLNQSVELKADNVLIDFNIEKKQYSYNSITKQKSVYIELSGVVAANKQVDVFSALVLKHQELLSSHIYIPNAYENGVVKIEHIEDQKIHSVLVPGGSFILGSTTGDKVEQPIRKSFVNSFYMMTEEVSEALYRLCIADLACASVNDDSIGNFPVNNVSYQNVNREFIPWLNTKTNSNYRLPTESEWEFAAKLNNRELENCSLESLDEQCNQLTPVFIGYSGTLGIKNLIGNVSEWVDSCWTPNHNKAAIKNCSKRVVKGGSWYDDPYDRRPSARFSRTINTKLETLGFRLVHDI